MSLLVAPDTQPGRTIDLQEPTRAGASIIGYEEWIESNRFSRSALPRQLPSIIDSSVINARSKGPPSLLRSWNSARAVSTSSSRLASPFLAFLPPSRREMPAQKMWDEDARNESNRAGTAWPVKRSDIFRCRCVIRRKYNLYRVPCTMVTLDTEQKPERQHCGRRMCAICRRIKRDKGNERHDFLS